MWEMLGVVIAVISLGLTILLERKKITTEFREIREGIKKKVVIKQQVTPKDPSPKPIPAPQTKDQPIPTGFQSTMLDIIKTFVAIAGGTSSFAFVVFGYYVTFNLPSNDGYYILILPSAMLAGFIYGVGVLRKKTWTYILRYLGIVFLSTLIIVLISVVIPYLI